MDEHGFLWSTLKESISHVSSTTAEQEMRTQIHHLLKLGVNALYLQYIDNGVLQNYLDIYYDSTGNISSWEQKVLIGGLGSVGEYHLR